MSRYRLAKIGKPKARTPKLRKNGAETCNCGDMSCSGLNCNYGCNDAATQS